MAPFAPPTPGASASEGESNSVPNDAIEIQPQPSDEERLTIAAAALLKGRRDLAIDNINDAVTSLGEACEIYAILKGPFAPVTADAHFLYGKSLLEQARLETEVLPAPAGEQEEDAEDESEENEENEEDGEEGESKSEGGDEAEGEEDEEADLSAPSPSAQNGVEQPLANGNGEPLANGSGGGEILANGSEGGELLADKSVVDLIPSLIQSVLGVEEEAGCLELAWEALEMAKVSYRKQLAEVEKDLVPLREQEERKEETEEQVKEIRKLQNKLSDTHLLLGEVAVESENYETAVDEFRTAIAILRDLEGEDGRTVAHALFSLGIAYSYDKKFKEGVDCFKKSVEIIELRIKNMKEKGELSEEDKKEISNLENLLPELTEKIADTEEAEKEKARIDEEALKEKVEIEALKSPIKNGNAVVNDISHLVKKKKKENEDEGSSSEPPAKRQCTESAQQNTSE